jgi:hypothetical protein
VERKEVDFLRRHVFFIACGVAGLVGVALAVTGLGAMPKVLEEMGKVERLYRELNALQGRPVNKATVDAEKQRIDRILADNNQVISKAAELYGYEPLVENVFPDGDTDARLKFLKAYNAAMGELMNSLVWGRPPTQTEVVQAEEKIEEERYRSIPLGPDRGAAESKPQSAGEASTPAGVLTKAGAKVNAKARASMQCAQQIYCYAIHFKGAGAGQVASLAFYPYLEDTGTLEPPLIEDCWWGQVGYWIQKDVVNAIVAVNEEAAAAAKERGEDRWVGIMPVKDVISIRLSDAYIVKDDDQYIGAPAGEYAEALPCATANTVFTESVSSPSYDVIQFTVKLVMDQRDIPRLVDRICKNRFHTLLRIAYRAVPPNRKMQGKIYGSEPAVNVVLDFETIMLGRFREMIPQPVCKDFEIKCPQREPSEEEGG